MDEWMGGSLEEWRSGGLEEWRSGGAEERRSGLGGRQRCVGDGVGGRVCWVEGCAGWKDEPGGKYRTALTLLPVEILGWAGRLWSAEKPTNSNPFLMQICW